MTTVDQKVIKVQVRVLIGAVIVVTGWLAWVIKRDFDYQAGIERAQEWSKQNNQILQELRAEWKEDRRMNEIRFKQIESNIQRQDVDIAILKVKLGI
jgi:hypothetical protein